MASERGHSIDEAEIARLLKSGSAQQLHVARANLVELKKNVEIQLADDRAGQRDELATRLNAGVGYDEACLRSFMESDHDWRGRATAFIQLADKTIVKINMRLIELNGGAKPRVAIAITGAGKTATHTADALNMLLQRSCHVFAFSTIGDDLVVITTEPERS